MCITNSVTQFNTTAGGAGGTDETGASKDTHQVPVTSMGALIDVPVLFFAWHAAKPRTASSSLLAAFTVNARCFYNFLSALLARSEQL